MDRTASHFGARMVHPPPEFDRELAEEFANILDQIDKRLVVVMRDGGTVIGTLTCVDQFSNIVLTEAVERIHVGQEFGDVERGLVLIRGDNLVVIGEIDEEKEQKTTLTQVSGAEILRAQREQEDELELREKKRVEAFKERGLHYIPHQNNHEFTFRLGEDQFN